MIVYPLDRLHQEVAYVAYHFHWSYGDIMRMEHDERRRWVEEAAAINRHLRKKGEDET